MKSKDMIMYVPPLSKQQIPIPSSDPVMDWQPNHLGHGQPLHFPSHKKGLRVYGFLR